MLSEFVKRYFKQHTPGFLIWAGCTSIAALITFALLCKIFFPGQLMLEQAKEAGQRVIIHLESGEIEGSPRHTRKGGRLSSGAPILGKEGLAPAPLATLIEQSPAGPVPIIGRDGTVPWKYYSRPFTLTSRPVVAILLTNLGLSKSLTENVLELPHNFTLSFSPYAADSPDWAKKAREAGFESLIDLPMEPVDYPLSDPGPYGLLEDMDINESSNRLHWVMARFPGFVGMLAPQSEKLTSNINAMRPVLIELASRGQLFIYVKTPQNSPLNDLARSRSLMAMGIDAIVDDDITPGSIEKQLDNLVSLAKTQGYAIGLAHSYPVTTEALARWSESLASQGVDLAPVSAVAKKEFP